MRRVKNVIFPMPAALAGRIHSSTAWRAIRSCLSSRGAPTVQGPGCSPWRRPYTNHQSLEREPRRRIRNAAPEITPVSRLRGSDSAASSVSRATRTMPELGTVAPPGKVRAAVVKWVRSLQLLVEPTPLVVRDTHADIEGAVAAEEVEFPLGDLDAVVRVVHQRTEEETNTGRSKVYQKRR